MITCLMECEIHTWNIAYAVELITYLMKCNLISFKYLMLPVQYTSKLLLTGNESKVDIEFSFASFYAYICHTCTSH